MAKRYVKQIPEYIYFVGDNNQSFIDGPFIHPVKDRKNRKFKIIEVFELTDLLKLVPVVSNHDDSQFTIVLPNGEEAVAMGDEFNPTCYAFTLEEMLKYINDGIEIISNIDKPRLKANDLGDYSDFFDTEFNDEPKVKYLTKEYVIAKLICGKENAKTATL